MSRLVKWLKEGAKLLGIFLLVVIAMDWWRGKDLPLEQMPAMVADTIEGERISLMELSQDQPVIIYFWATWCPVCEYVSPAIDTMSEYYPVVTVALSSGEDGKLAKYMAHHDYDFPVVNDPGYWLGKNWGIKVTPTILVVKNGKITSYTTGFTSLPGIWLRALMA